MLKLWENPMLSTAEQLEVAKGEINRLTNLLIEYDNKVTRLELYLCDIEDSDGDQQSDCHDCGEDTCVCD